MFIALGILATIGAVGVWLTERVDRPARRRERELQA